VMTMMMIWVQNLINNHFMKSDTCMTRERERNTSILAMTLFCFERWEAAGRSNVVLFQENWFRAQQESLTQTKETIH